MCASVLCAGLLGLSFLAPRPASADDSAPKKPKILIVPGHEPDNGGAEFGKVKERDLAVELSEDLREYLEADGGYEVFVTRNGGSWDPVFQGYFDAKWQDILDWKRKAKQDLSQLIAIGSTSRMMPTIIHNKADSDAATRLYGITKWANENGIDLVIHVHLNDDPVRKTNAAGTFSGFAIYAPAEQYSNSMQTHSAARSVFKRLALYNAVSDLPQESQGIIDDPDLIAVGANDTSRSPSMLIEYGYIYARQFTDPVVRPLALKDLAHATYLGLQEFFGRDADRAPGSHDSSLLPYLWTSPVTATSSPRDIFALQTSLAAAGAYPPRGKTKNDCPRSGLFGSCTKSALASFQRDREIEGESGVAGEKTIAALHANF